MEKQLLVKINTGKDRKVVPFYYLRDLAWAI